MGLDYYLDPGSVGGGYVWQVDADGDLGLYYDGLEICYLNNTGSGGGQTVQIVAGDGNGYINIGNGSVEVPALYVSDAGSGVTFNGLIGVYNDIATVDNGVPAEYASTGPSGQVALGTGSTAILSYTPTANALFLVVANFTHKSATVAGTATLTYEDVGLSATATQSYTIASAASGVSVSQIFLCCAVSGTAIALVGTSATANDILASAVIFQL
jgi:hypothetical protein